MPSLIWRREWQKLGLRQRTGGANMDLPMSFTFSGKHEQKVEREEADQ